MDLARSVFSTNQCAEDIENPVSRVVNKLLTRDALHTQFQHTELDHLEDAWESAELATNTHFCADPWEQL